MNETSITDKDDLIGKKIPQNDKLFSPKLLLNNNPFTYKKYHNAANEKLQLQTIHETYPSAIKQSNNSFFDPSIFKFTS